MGAKRITPERVAKAYKVPYWLVDTSRPKPSWFRRPIWRIRALIWARIK